MKSLYFRSNASGWRCWLSRMVIGPLTMAGALYAIPKDAVVPVQGQSYSGWQVVEEAAGKKAWATAEKYNKIRIMLRGRGTPGSGMRLALGSEAIGFPVAANGTWTVEAAYEAVAGVPGVLRFWPAGGAEVRREFAAPPVKAKESDFRVPVHLEGPADWVLDEGWVQPLDRGEHAAMIGQWGVESLARGQKIYESLCTICHGSLTQAGSLPTALRFGEGIFKNGGDPHSMWLTLTRGYGQMAAMPQYTTREKYDVIHYIRETFLRTANPSQLITPDAASLADLPRGMTTVGEAVAQDTVPVWLKMDFGPALHWTYQVAPGNIAYKGVAIRLDEGPGGISKGRAWMVYDHDTMRLAAAWTGSGFVDWKSIAFDGSHQTHTSIAGTPTFVNAAEPGWADPDTGTWQDPRPQGRDGKPYGPLPAAWMKYRGLHLHGSRAVISYTVGGTGVLETPGLTPRDGADVFTRTLNVSPNPRSLVLRIAPEQAGLTVALRTEQAAASLRVDGGFHVLTFSPSQAGHRLRVYVAGGAPGAALAAAGGDGDALDLLPLTRGGPPRWPATVTTPVMAGAGGATGAGVDGKAAFAVETLTLPDDNPWGSWMRGTGFDFMRDEDRAALCTWNGDVFMVSGISQASGRLTWRRIASGLHQPLGLKIVRDDIYLTCRDQLAVLRDRNGDGETDFVECFNNHHQVTEHFHEFAMGLQADAAGNFYYAKSGRHALPAVVPQHGTLLRVSADGSKTDILATGFRAANGVCLNPDGTFFVTDQEGYWMPKNRINHVPAGSAGFYGNQFGYYDEAAPVPEVRAPLAWITNAVDRSPAELLWVPPGQWGPLAGALLHTSYGTGKLYIVPHENVGGQMQGGIVPLPLPEFPSGIMRGRFHPGTGDLYLTGMVAWATNRTVAGGFYRLRPTGQPLGVPVSLRARPDGLALTFSEPVDEAAATTAASFSYQTWTLRYTEKYGSDHFDERQVPVRSARLLDARTVLVTPENMTPSQCYRLAWQLRRVDGTAFQGSMDGTLHKLQP